MSTDGRNGTMQPWTIGSGEAGPSVAIKPISKAEAVRRALLVGVESPQEGVWFIKQEFGIEILPAVFSQYKYKFRPAKSRQARHTERANHHAPTTDGDGLDRPIDNAEDLLTLVKVVKDLVSRMGVERVHELVELFR
jgi:hypothetical protein